MRLTIKIYAEPPAPRARAKLTAPANTPETRARRRFIEPAALGRASGMVIPSQTRLARCAPRSR